MSAESHDADADADAAAAAAWSCSRIGLVLCASSLQRVIEMLEMHPAVRSIDQVDKSWAPTRILNRWLILTLRDAAAAPHFIAELVKMPSFFKSCLRIMPVEHVAANLSSVLEDARITAAGSTFRVHAYPTLNRKELIDQLELHGVALEPARYTHQLSILRVLDRWHWSVVPAAADLVEPHAPNPNHICRAYCKVEEVFERHLRHEFDLDGARVIDVGAAPGGWTEYLQGRCKEVVAIDPAEMHAKLATWPNVRHLKMLSQDAAPLLLAEDKFDILCCDMNQPWKDALDRLEALIALIRPGGCMCFTLKHCNVGRNTARVDEAVRLACAHLAPVFDRIQVQWLFSNSERERTILAFKRADQSA